MTRKLIFSARRKDFRVDTFRSGGPGGQNQNKVESGVRITHIATGISAESREHRDQPQNRKAAWKRVCQRLLAHVLREEHVDRRQTEVVRTYHAVRNVVKDHRTGTQQLYTDTLEGDLDAFVCRKDGCGCARCCPGLPM